MKLNNQKILKNLGFKIKQNKKNNISRIYKKSLLNN